MRIISLNEELVESFLLNNINIKVNDRGDLYIDSEFLCKEMYEELKAYSYGHTRKEIYINKNIKVRLTLSEDEQKLLLRIYKLTIKK